MSCPLVVAEPNKCNVVKVASGSKAKKHEGRKRKSPEPATVTLESVFHRYAQREFIASPNRSVDDLTVSALKEALKSRGSPR